MSADKKAELFTFPEKVRYKPETAEAVLAVFEGEQSLQDGPAWLAGLRREAAEALAEGGLPTPRLERWKFSNLPPAVRDNMGAWNKAAITLNDTYKSVDSLVGNIAKPQKWLDNIISKKQDGLYRYGDAMLWNMADMFLRDGLVIDIPENEIYDSPIDLTIKGCDTGFVVPRIIVRVGAGADVTIVERHEGEGAFWNNQTTQIVVGRNARLRHYRIQENGAQVVYTQNTHITVERDATYEAFTLCAGSGLSRNQVHVEMAGENGTCNIYGLNTLRGSQHGDTTIEIEHEVPHCNSFQFIRSVLDDQARGVFQGKVHVYEGADQTDGTQMSNALIMSEGAEMDTKPELEIYADEVQCAHGATTGKLEDEPLFYMRSRGLSEDVARRLLIEAFIGEVLDKIGDEAVHDLVHEKVLKWLG